MPVPAIITLFLLSGTPVSACSDPPRIASSVAAMHQQVVEQSTFDLVTLREMARRSGMPLRHKTLGFYLGAVGQEIRIDTQTVYNSDKTRCDNLTTVTVRLSLVNRLIEVANDLDAENCQAAAVLRHYRRHALADDAALSRLVLSLTNDLQKAWPQMTVYLSQSGDDDVPGLRRVVEGVLASALRDYEPRRTEAIAAVDSPREIESLACGSPT